MARHQYLPRKHQCYGRRIVKFARHVMEKVDRIYVYIDMEMSIVFSIKLLWNITSSGQRARVVHLDTSDILVCLY